MNVCMYQKKVVKSALNCFYRNLASSGYISSKKYLCDFLYHPKL